MISNHYYSSSLVWVWTTVSIGGLRTALSQKGKYISQMLLLFLSSVKYYKYHSSQQHNYTCKEHLYFFIKLIKWIKCIFSHLHFLLCVTKHIINPSALHNLSCSVCCSDKVQSFKYSNALFFCLHLKLS